MHARLLLLTLAVCPLIAAPVDLPTRAAAENQIPQDPPTVQALQVVNTFLRSVSAGNPSQAYYGYTAKDFRGRVRFEDFKNFIQRFPALFRNRSANHQKEEYYDKSPLDYAVPGDVVLVDSLVESFDGQRNIASFVLTFEAGQWRVFSLEMFPAPPRNELQ